VLYVCGDIHQPGECETAFDRWLERLARRPPAHLVILGDLFDTWLETTAGVARHVGTLERLRALRHRGWRLDLIQGNRELAGHHRLRAATRMPVHWPDLVLELGPRRLRVVHGDRLCRDPGYHFFAASVRSFWFQGSLRWLPDLGHDLVARWFRRRSLAKRRRESGRSGGASALRLTPGRLRAAARGVDGVIAGHIHQQWRRRLAGVDLMLVGDWGARHGHWIEGYADGRLRLTGARDLR